jgi:hypothetical protein
VQSVHAAPFAPQAESSVPPMQPMFGSQQPLHDAPQVDASAPEDASSPGLSASSPPPPLVLPPLVLPPLPEAPPPADALPLVEDDADDPLEPPSCATGRGAPAS